MPYLRPAVVCRPHDETVLEHALGFESVGNVTSCLTDTSDHPLNLLSWRTPQPGVHVRGRTLVRCMDVVHGNVPVYAYDMHPSVCVCVCVCMRMCMCFFMCNAFAEVMLMIRVRVRVGVRGRVRAKVMLMIRVRVGVRVRGESPCARRGGATHVRGGVGAALAHVHEERSGGIMRPNEIDGLLTVQVAGVCPVLSVRGPCASGHPLP